MSDSEILPFDEYLGLSRERVSDADCERASKSAEPVIEENLKPWAKFLEEGAFIVKPRMRYALRLIAGGVPYRQAAIRAGFKDHAGIYTYARRYNLGTVSTGEILKKFKRVASLSADEIEHRIVEQPDDVSTRDLSIAGGIAMDKVQRAEERSKSTDTSFLDRLEELTQRVIAAGGSLEVKVTGAPQGELADAIDVTPTKPVLEDGE